MSIRTYLKNRYLCGENYIDINRLNNELKKIESKIDTLKMREASGADVDTILKIEKMGKDFIVQYSLYIYLLD